MESASRENADGSIASELDGLAPPLGPTKRTWGRELTPKIENERCDWANSISQKKILEESGLLVENEEDRSPNSDRSCGRRSSVLSWSFVASKNTTKE